VTQRNGLDFFSKAHLTGSYAALALENDYLHLIIIQLNCSRNQACALNFDDSK
jgi:hypothetical protein